MDFGWNFIQTFWLALLFNNFQRFVLFYSVFGDQFVAFVRHYRDLRLLIIIVNF